MALIEMDFATGGGENLSETVIWTNSSPTSTFADTTIILSDNISNYKFLKFVYRISTSNADEHSLLVDCNDFVSALNSSEHCAPSITFYGTTATLARRVFYVSDTQINFDRNIQISGTQVLNQYNIPVEIIGLK